VDHLPVDIGILIEGLLVILQVRYIRALALRSGIDGIQGVIGDGPFIVQRPLQLIIGINMRVEPVLVTEIPVDHAVLDSQVQHLVLEAGEYIG
jgi:hypothetical protein